MHEQRQSCRRTDERDTIFARMARMPATPAHAEYYGRRPELRAADDRLRGAPPLLKPGGRMFDARICGEAERWFDSIERFSPDPEFVLQWTKRLESSPAPSSVVKEMALALGAVAAGCAAVDRDYVYTHKGRFDSDYGNEIRLDHHSAVVFLVEMEADEMQQAPRAEVIRESARQYYRAALIAKSIRSVLAACGHDAKAQYDAHYDVILPPLAVAAGLGEIGRNNILVADRFGSRVRIGAVTTSLVLEHDSPLQLGVQRFCEVCRKCAENCPSRALDEGPRSEVNGVDKWRTDAERCYGYWRAAGTDCGICMAICPFSHRDNRFHNAVRAVLRRAPRLARAALFFDDLLYGRRWPRRDPR
jgi:ferredoxin